MSITCDPLKVPLIIRNNQGLTKVFLITDETGKPLNLTGYSAKGSFKTTADVNAASLYDLTLGTNLSFGDPTLGKLTVTIPAADAVVWTWNNAIYDLIIGIGGTWLAIAEGPVTVTGGVTHP